MITTKRCPRCDADLPLDAFWKNAARHDGLQSYCKRCHKEYRPDGDRDRRDYRLRYDYGIDAAEYDSIRARQDGCCAICGVHETDLDGRLCVDHDHDSGLVRGLLCRECNVAIGKMGDDPDMLRCAIDYLEGV